MDGPADIRPMARTIDAPAKINLSLHVVGRRPDGYHLMDGLVVFAGIGDRLTIEDAREDRLTIGGPMAGSTPATDNILIKALAAARAIAARHGIQIGCLALHLEKNLPVAAGLGGGSADAAALLRWLDELHPRLGAKLRAGATALGADVPMCMGSMPSRVSGIGEIVESLAAMPSLPLLLVNPNVPVETASVFRALESASDASPPPFPSLRFGGRDELLSYLTLCRNDLELPARHIAPVIGEIFDRLETTGADLVRMSGSGGTVFAIYNTDAQAAAAAAAISDERPGWWVYPTRSLGTSEARK